MTLDGFDIYRYRLPLNRPLTLRGITLHEREGLLICLTNENSQVGWGEIAPLPGFNTESIEEALVKTRDLRFALRRTLLPPNLEELSGAFADWLRAFHLPSSVQCGFEAAVLNLLAVERETTLAQLISDLPLAEIDINGLISTDISGLDIEIGRIVTAGYKAVKVKVGRSDIHTDITFVRRVRASLPSAVTLRLDANRSWAFEEAVLFAEGIKDIALAYIEEPLDNPARLPEFAQVTGLPIALDESLRECEPETIPYLEIARAAIIRPGQLGGLERAMRFARRVRAAGKSPVVSSNIESAVGIAALAGFAAAVTPMGIPVGLDTLSWFDRQVVALPLSQSHARIDVAVANRNARSVEVGQLERISHD